MTGPTYPAARSVAERIQGRLATCGGNGVTTSKVIEEVVTAAFWASLRREEGRAPTVSLAFVSPEHVSRPLKFGAQLPLDPDVLVKLAPAVERPGIHLGVWPGLDNQLRVWGTTRSVPTSCFVLEVIEPGLLVVKFRRNDRSTKFQNIAVLDGAKVKFIAQQDGIITEAPKALRSLLTFYSSAGREESDHVLVRLAISMRAHQRGGSLLVVSGDNDEWRQSLVKPISYPVNPPFSEIDGLSNDPESLRSAIDALAGWTAVDGATVISDHFALLASGVKIVSRDASKRVHQVLVTEPVEGVEPAVVEPSQLGNTRHLSAAQFVHDQRDSIALVASQDGRFTVFAWSPSGNIVRAHRMETLLL
jgi:sensor domain DACNV-containing protein